LKTDNKAENADDPNKVGKEEVKFGFGVGKAPNNSKPTFQMDNSLVASQIK